MEWCIVCNPVVRHIISIINQGCYAVRFTDNRSTKIYDEKCVLCRKNPGDHELSMMCYDITHQNDEVLCINLEDNIPNNNDLNISNDEERSIMEQLAKTHTDLYRSEEINHIMGALAKAQGSYKKLIANQDTPGGKFANLQAILDAVRDSLAQNGLGFFQFIELLDEGSGAALLKTTLGHESGQFISSSARVITGKTERQTGNIYEIHKRLHALMILGIAPSSNDPIAFDDNGEIMAEQHLIASLRKPDSPTKESIDHTDVINKTQYEELMIELSGFEKIAKDILQVYDLATLADLPASEYHRARAKILKIKRTQEEYLRKK